MLQKQLVQLVVYHVCLNSVQSGRNFGIFTQTIKFIEDLSFSFNLKVQISLLVEKSYAGGYEHGDTIMQVNVHTQRELYTDYEGRVVLLLVVEEAIGEEVLLSLPSNTMSIIQSSRLRSLLAQSISAANMSVYRHLSLCIQLSDCITLSS